MESFKLVSSVSEVSVVMFHCKCRGVALSSMTRFKTVEFIAFDTKLPEVAMVASAAKTG